jgi:Zn-dependent peptidase ImmA (M78 family)/transcriptional regulator with XRE-family HTH domain
MPKVNPEILRWARETACLSLEDAATKLGIDAARGIPGPERLGKLEVGEGEPTRSLLAKMAKQYRRPLLTFYLPAPPRTGERGQDFRTLPPEYSKRDNALVDALIRDVRARQGMVRALLEAEDEATLLPFVGSMSVRDGVEAVLASIVMTLELNLTQFRRDNRQKGFPYLRERAECAGIFVLLIGNLGSHHSNLDVEMFRGFALSDPIAPFIVINDQDANTAWSFTLLHELAHIWLGQTGISGANAATNLEQFCNDVAGQFLLPAHEIAGEEKLRDATFESLVARINEIAEERQVSCSLVAYKLHRQGVIAQNMWGQLGRFFRQQWINNRQAERNRDRDGSGPNYYVVRRHRVGSRLIGLTRRMLADGSLAPSQAAKILGVKLSNVFALIAEDGSRPPSRAA